MTDENTTGAPAPTTTASSGEQTVPISRLNELIADRNDLRGQVNMMGQTLNQLLAQQRPQQRPVEEAPHMKQLREENPAAYRTFMEQDKRIKNITASHAAMIDNQDRMMFINEFGNEGKKSLEKVEQYLQRERDTGNYKANRAGIYVWLKGQERLQQDLNPPPAAPTPAPVPKAEAQTPNDIPPSIPYSKGANIPAGFGSLSQSARKETVDQMRERFKNTVF